MDPFYFYVIVAFVVLIANMFEQVRTYSRKFMAAILGLASTIGFVITSIFAQSDEVFFHDFTWNDSLWCNIIFFGLCALVSAFLGAKREIELKSNSLLASENKRLNKDLDVYRAEYYKLCSNIIKDTFNDFYATGQDRVSIYKHQGDHFSLLGRYSPIGDYNSKKSYDYKDGEGLIGKAWNEGNAFISNSPDWKTNKKAYYDFQMKHSGKLTKQRINQISMKSRSLYAQTIDDSRTPENPDGIIVFESMSPTHVQKEFCITAIKDNQTAILTLLKNMRSLTNKVRN